MDKDYIYYLLDTCDRDIEYHEYRAESIHNALVNNGYTELYNLRNDFLKKAKRKMRGFDRDKQINTILFDEEFKPCQIEETEEYKMIVEICYFIKTGNIHSDSEYLAENIN